MTVKDSIRQRHEEEANQFAMCLLMPEEFVRREVAKFGGKFDVVNDVKKLAKTFDVPEPIMTIRLMQIYKGLRNNLWTT